MKRINTLVLAGSIVFASFGVAEAADNFVKAYIVKSSVSVDGKKVSSNVYKINNDLYINAKSLNAQTLKSSVSTNKVEVTNKLNVTVKDLQSQVKELKANIEKLTVGEDKSVDLTTGFYTGGLNLPIGTYTISSKSGAGNLVIYDGKGMLKVNEIMSLTESGTTPKVNNVPLDKGSKIEITGDAVITFTKKY